MLLSVECVLYCALLPIVFSFDGHNSRRLNNFLCCSVSESCSTMTLIEASDRSVVISLVVVWAQ